MLGQSCCSVPALGGVKAGGQDGRSSVATVQHDLKNVNNGATGKRVMGPLRHRIITGHQVMSAPIAQSAISKQPDTKDTSQSVALCYYCKQRWGRFSAE